MSDTSKAAIAFFHFAFFVIGWSGKRAGHCTAVTADAVGIIINGKARFRIFFQTARRAGLDAWGIFTVHTGKRHESHLILRIWTGFQSKALAERAIACCDINIILIHAGDGACGAAYTFSFIQYKHITHDSTSAFSIRQRSCLKPGNPEYGSRNVFDSSRLTFASSYP